MAFNLTGSTNTLAEFNILVNYDTVIHPYLLTHAAQINQMIMTLYKMGTGTIYLISCKPKDLVISEMVKFLHMNIPFNKKIVAEFPTDPYFINLFFSRWWSIYGTTPYSSDVIFVDNIPINLFSAKAAGMRTISVGRFIPQEMAQPLNAILAQSIYYRQSRRMQNKLY